jgi:hypothetical protein
MKSATRISWHRFARFVLETSGQGAREGLRCKIIFHRKISSVIALFFAEMSAVDLRNINASATLPQNAMVQ